MIQQALHCTGIQYSSNDMFGMSSYGDNSPQLCSTPSTSGLQFNTQAGSLSSTTLPSQTVCQTAEASATPLSNNTCLGEAVMHAHQAEEEDNMHVVPIGSNFVRDVLQMSAARRAIEVEYRQTGHLTSNQRTVIQNAIIRKLVDNYPLRQIQPIEFTKLSHQIAHIFPSEAPSVWYGSSVPKTIYQKKKNCSGLLYQSYLMKRREYRLQMGATPVRRKSTSSITSENDRRESGNSEQADAQAAVVEPPRVTADTFASPDNAIVQEYITWLQSNATTTADARQIEHRWMETRVHRLQCLKNGLSKYSSINEYFDTFRPLQNPILAPSLVS